MAKAVKAAVIVAGIATGVGIAFGLAAVGSATFAAAGFALTGASAYFATTFVTSLVLGGLSQALAKTPTGASITQQDRTVTSRQPIAPHGVIYGRSRIGGVVLYMESTNSNKYLHMVVAIAGHEIDAIESFYFNEKQITIDGSGNVTGGQYNGKARIQYKLGTDGQTAFSDLVSESDGKWTANHRVRGSALVYLRLEYDQDAYFNGIPNLSVIVRGKKVYDPRTATSAWSANPALCVVDYLTNSKYGLGSVYANEIDESSLIAAANICDEDVNKVGGGAENRYEVHGSFSTSSQPDDIINQMVFAMAGKCVWSGGVWRILAGAYYTPTLSFDENDLRSGFKVQTLVSRRENFNGVKGVFSSIDDNYVLSDFPPITSSAFVTQDNGEENLKSIELPWTTSASMAQRLAKIELLRARQQITLSMPMKLIGMKANVGDVVLINNTRMGWSSKPFEVVGANIAFGNAIGIDLDLREVASNVYSWSTDEESSYDAAPNTNLPNAFYIAPVENLTLAAINSITADGGTQSGVLVSWDLSTNAFVTRYEVQYIRGAANFDWGLISESPAASSSYGFITGSVSSRADYGSVADATAATESNYNSLFVNNPYYVISSAVTGSEYSVRVRAINALGVKSAFVSASEITYGDQTAPNPPGVVNAFGNYKQIAVTWVNPTVADFDYIEVYSNTVNSSATASRVAVIRGSTYIDSPLGINVTRYYWVKAVDRTGNTSGFSAGVSATTEFIDSDSFSAEVLNLFSEAGAYGIEPVATLPATGDFDGQIKYQTTLNKLYRWDASTTAWTDDIFSITSGSVDEASFAAGIEPIKVVAELPSPTGYTGAKVVFLTTDNKLYRYDGAAWVTGTLAADIDGTLAASNFSQDLRPVEVVSALPSSDNFAGRTAVLTTDNKLYRYTGTAWTAAVNSTDISGTLSAAQIASLTAAQITGTLTNSQIADLSAAKITGSIVGTQILDGAISTAKLAAGSVSTAKLSAGAVTSDIIAANAITSAKIESGAITTAKLAAGSVTATQLAADSVSADKIQANAIGTDELAANAITAGKIAAGAIVSDKLEANAVTAGKIAAGAVSADQIAANAITSEKINAQAITSAKIKAGDIQGDRIAANTITGGLIAASGIITDTAQINDSVITNAKIANAAITTAKIGDLQVTGLKIANGAITLSAFASDNGFSRFFTAGTFTAGISGIDTFASLTFPTNVGDDITVEVHYVFNSEDYQSSAGTNIKIRPMISIAGVEKSDYSQKFWSVFETTSHIPNNLKIRVVGTGSSMTATLRMYYEIVPFYNPAYTAYEVTNCIISAFASRK